DRLSERLPLLRIPNRIVECGHGDADAAGRDIDAAEFETPERVTEAEALLTADQILGRNRIVLEDQLGGVDALVAELLELAADGEPRALLGEEQAGALV